MVLLYACQGAVGAWVLVVLGRKKNDIIISQATVLLPGCQKQEGKKCAAAAITGHGESNAPFYGCTFLRVGSVEAA